MKVRIERADGPRVDGSDRMVFRYEARGYERRMPRDGRGAVGDTLEVTVTFDAYRDLGIGAWMDYIEPEREAVHSLGGAQSECVEIQPPRVVDPDGFVWRPIHVTAREVPAHAPLDAEVPMTSRLESGDSDPSGGWAPDAGVERPFSREDYERISGREPTDEEWARVEMPEPVPALFEPEWLKVLAAQEEQAMHVALERAGTAAQEFGARFELLLGGVRGSGETPYTLRLHTARGVISHRKTIRETWNEAVGALGL